MSTVTGASMRLEDWAKISNNPVTKGLVAALYDTQSVLKDVPFVTDPALKATGIRIGPGGLPSVGYGALNETPNKRRTVPEQHEETAFLIRDNVYMDRRYRNPKNYTVSPVKIQSQGLMEAWARQINNDVINNDPATGAAGGPAGWRVRLASSTNRAKYGHADECAIAAGNIDCTAAMTKAGALALFEAVDQQLQYMNAADGNGVVLYMNDTMLRRFSTAGKLCDGGGGFDTTKDNYDRSIQTYKNARLRDIGRMSDDTTRIIASTETQDGAAQTGGTWTSIYGVRYGGAYLTGWHDGSMDLKYVGTDDTGTQDIWLLDYAAGFYHGHSRTITRLSGLKVA